MNYLYNANSCKKNCSNAKIERESIQEKIDAGEAKQAAQNREQKEYLTQQTKIDVQKNRTEMTLENRMNYLSGEYQLTFEQALQEYTETEAIDEAKQQVAVLKEKIEKLRSSQLEFDRTIRAGK
jgi:chromosome segregation protein